MTSNIGVILRQRVEMAVDIIYLCVCLIAMAGKCIDTKLHNATSAMETLVDDSFPKDTEINETCVAEGCPALKNISLCQSGMKINMLQNIKEITSKCMRGPMCGKVIDPIRLRSLALSTEELLPGVAIAGTCAFIPGTTYTSNISNIQLENQADQSQDSQLRMTMLIPNIRAQGRLKLDVSLETDFGPAITASLTQITFDIGVQFTSTVTINQTGPDFNIAFVNPILKARPQFGGFHMPLGLPDIEKLFTASVQNVFEGSSMAKAIGTYMENIYKTAFKVVSKNCKSLNSTS